MNTQRLLDRFLRYVKIDTTASTESDTYPSSPGQWELGKVLLVEELNALGASDVRHDEHALVWGTIPGNCSNNLVVAFNSHIDTSPETTGKNVQPQVIEDYQGGDITLPADTSQVIRVAENPELKKLIGHTLITTDGTTLLGSDDKAVWRSLWKPPHGCLRILMYHGRRSEYCSLVTKRLVTEWIMWIWANWERWLAIR